LNFVNSSLAKDEKNSILDKNKLKLEFLLGALIITVIFVAAIIILTIATLTYGPDEDEKE